MKTNGVDPRFLKTSGVEVYTGNELLVKGALEAGAGLITGYPGSPVSDTFDVLSEIAPYLVERGIVAQIANNEALSTARLNGARQAGLRAMAVMKSVGLHVAADALAIGNLMEFKKPAGGALVVVGDDPWNETTQINSDSRYLSKHLNIPIIEPSTFQELKDWIKEGFDLSGYADLYVTYVVTTNQADGGASVEVHPHPDLAISHQHKTTLSSDQINISESVLIPPHTSWREATLAERMTRFLTRARERGLTQWKGPKSERKAVGFVTAGLSYSYLEEVLRLLGLWGQLPVLKLGVTYPLDRSDILKIAKRVEHLVVVEEKRGFLESQIAEILVSEKQAGRLARPPALWGKKFPNEIPGIPSNRGLNVSVLLEILGPAFMRWKEHFPTLDVALIERELAEITHTRSSSFDVPLRTPTFCPGCPHRDSATVSLDLKKKFKAKGVDVIYHGESGCHSMLQFAPNEGLMQNYSGMGLGGGTGAGMAPFITNKQVVFLGDSTFFHSGVIAISDSIKNNQDITYVILENKTTAMTGHQPTPGNEIDIMGNVTAIQDIERLLTGMISQGVTLIKMNPAERHLYQPLLEETVLKPGVKVIIADKECAITLHRRKNEEKKQIIREQGFLARQEKININQEACEYCLECTRATGCPGLTVTSTAYGPKIATDLSTCVDDAACARTKACPSFEKVTIQRSRAPQKAAEKEFDFSTLTLPNRPVLEGRWSAYTAAIGGMGAGIVNAILVRAGLKQGYEVSFLDKKGLAIRNGGVYGHVVFSNNGPIRSPVIPYGKADLLVGLDLLEAARALDARMNLRVAHPARTHAVINNHKNETILSLMGRENFEPAKLEQVILGKIRLGGYLSADFSDISEQRLGSKLYANIMVLGAAFQKGWIPLSEENILTALKESVRPSDLQTNIKAFRLGRLLSTKPDFLHPDGGKNWLDVVSLKEKYLKQEYALKGGYYAREYRKLIEQINRWMDLPEGTRLLLASTVYDLIRFGGLKAARTYIAEVWAIYKKDRKKFGLLATHAVVANLFKVMAIKDEVWVARLLTSPEKYDRDRARYGIDEANGDKISYVHFNRPRFTVLGFNIEFDLQARDWMLHLMKHMGFLRRWLPQWHQKERAFRRWYMAKVESFTFFDSEEDYLMFVDILNSPDAVRGYREVRYAAMRQARENVQSLLGQLKSRSSTTVKTPAPVTGQ